MAGRKNAAQRLAAVHMTIVAEGLRVVTGLAVSSTPLGIDAMSEAIVDVVHHLSGQYRRLVIPLCPRRNHADLFCFRKLREHGCIMTLRTETLRMAITALGIHYIQAREK